MAGHVNVAAICDVKLADRYQCFEGTAAHFLGT
jgi:hypothetical protein